MKNKFAKAGLAGLALVGAGAFALAGANTALADPPTTRAPHFDAAGSDTIQDVYNAFANGWTNSGTAVAAIADLSSYDAFPKGSTITVKGVTMTRPSGSGDGRKALSASWDASNHLWNGVDIFHTIDIARSSGKPSATGTALTSVPFARDAVTTAIKNTSITNLTTAQLTHIYNCTTSAADGVTVSGTTVTVNGTTVQPKIPQSGSGTRAFFLGAIGVSAPGACVSSVGVAGGTDSLLENHANELVNTGDLVPFSAAQYISQFNGVITDTGVKVSGFNLLQTNGVSAAVGSPKVPNSAYYGSSSTAPTGGVGVFNRDMYSVVPSANIDSSASNYSSYGTYLKTLVTTTIPGQTTTLNKYGFQTITYANTPAQWILSGYEH